MDITPTLASQSYEKARVAAAPLAEGGNPSGAVRWIESFAETLENGEATARAAMTGGADPHALVQALASTQMAVETVTTVRDKVVEAYQELMRMAV